MTTEPVVPHLLAIAMQIPDVLMDLQESLVDHGMDVSRTAQDTALLERWKQAEPESRAALLLSAAWGAREKELPTEPVTVGLEYARDLHGYAKAETDSEKFHGVSYPAMPLPGQAGALASSYAFDRSDLRHSLRTVLILLAAARG